MTIGAGDDNRVAEPPEQRGKYLVVPVLGVEHRPSGQVSVIGIGALRELLAQDPPGELGEIRRTVEQPDEGQVPHRLVGQQRFRLWSLGFAGARLVDLGAQQLPGRGT